MDSSSLVTLDSNSYLFDRRRTDHPWLDALNSLEKSVAPGHAPLAKNWRMDPRVDTVREEHIERSGCFPTTGGTLAFESAVQHYFIHFQCRSPSVSPCAAYVEAANDGNIIPVDERPSRNHHLLHLASMNRLLKFIYRGGNENLADFQVALRRLTGQRIPADINNAAVDKLADVLQSKGEEAVKKFARMISDTLGNSEPLWWAAFAHEIGDLSNITDWSDAVRKTGLGHLEFGERLIAWRYSPEIAGRLYRPSVAEAGANGFHFPSPPMTSYGITMPLMAGMPAVRELIHPPLKNEISEEACTGCIGKIEQNPVEIRSANFVVTWFEKRRQAHANYLVQNQPGLAKAWLQRHQMYP